MYIHTDKYIRKGAERIPLFIFLKTKRENLIYIQIFIPSVFHIIYLSLLKDLLLQYIMSGSYIKTQTVSLEIYSHSLDVSIMFSITIFQFPFDNIFILIAIIYICINKFIYSCTDTCYIKVVLTILLELGTKLNFNIKNKTMVIDDSHTPYL